MHSIPSDIAFTPAVKALQKKRGSRKAYAEMEARSGWRTRVDSDLKDFLGSLDMFYLGTANAQGQPYIQYRGGPRGFLQPLGERSLAFADFAGNQQFISLGNVSENPRVFLFLMDYVTQRRIKIWGTARVIENDDALIAKLQTPDYPGRVERAIVVDIESWDANCRQHIHRRLPVEQVQPVIEALRERIVDLESRLDSIKDPQWTDK